MNKNTILVVMPVYNAEKTLRKAIEGVLKQSYTNIHLAIVDDCSTDSSYEIAKSYLGDYRVSLYRNRINMGAYYCRNYGLYAHRNDPWGYFTTHDADDFSLPSRYEIMSKYFKNNIVAVQDAVERIHLDTGKSEGVSVTMAHAVFAREVFENVGYFDSSTRFAADWEHWTRMKAQGAEKGKRAFTYRGALGESYLHGNNLTTLVPINSDPRLDYVARAQAEITEMVKNDNFYRDFVPETKVTGKAKSSKQNPRGLRVAVVLLTWKRIHFLKQTLRSLSRQTHSEFDIVISNSNSQRNSTVERYAEMYANLNINVRHDSNEHYSYRRIFIGKGLVDNGYDVVMFIDDDIEIPQNYIEEALKQYEPKTYKSAYAWKFDSGKAIDYYKNRTRVKNTFDVVDYCGTGVSMMDASLFLDSKFSNPPVAAYKIEDLWMSFVVAKKPGWSCKYMDIPNVIIGGADEVALHKQILKEETNKTDFLEMLVKEKGWKL